MQGKCTVSCFPGRAAGNLEQPGRHRRVRLADVLAYHERSRRHRPAGLDQMVADAEDAGLYELPSDVPYERLPIEDGGE
jgi:hypothetical protein